MPTSIVTKVDGRCCLICKIEERGPGKGEGDLLILFPKGKNRDMSKLGSQVGSSRHNEDIRQFKLSVHRSPESASGINVLMKEYILDGKVQWRVPNYVSGIKAGKIEPAVSVRHTDMMSENYLIAGEKSRLIEIPEYDPINFTMFTTMFVCRKDKWINLDVFEDSYARRIDTTYFSLIFLASWATVPAHPAAGAVYSPYTTPDKPSDSGGFTEGECAAYFNVYRVLLLKEYVKLIEGEAPSAAFRRYLPYARFFSRGCVTRAFRRWIAEPASKPFQMPDVDRLPVPSLEDFSFDEAYDRFRQVPLAHPRPR